MISEGKQRSNTLGCNIFHGDSIDYFFEKCDSTGECLDPSWKRYTRKNPDPNPIEPVDNPERLLGEGKKKNLIYPPLLSRSTSLSTEVVQTIQDLQFDYKFQHSLFISKSDSDLKEIVEDLSSVLTFVPKKYCSTSQKNKQLLWDSWES